MLLSCQAELFGSTMLLPSSSNHSIPSISKLINSSTTLQQYSLLLFNIFFCISIYIHKHLYFLSIMFLFYYLCAYASPALRAPPQALQDGYPLCGLQLWWYPGIPLFILLYSCFSVCFYFILFYFTLFYLFVIINSILTSNRSALTSRRARGH